MCLHPFFSPYSECNSNRDSVLSYTSVRSNSSYLGSDEMGSGKRVTRVSFTCAAEAPTDLAIMTRSDS